MACRACAEEALTSGGVGSRIELNLEKLEMAGWTMEQREKSLVFFSPLPEKKRFKSSRHVLDYLKSRGEFDSFIQCHCGFSTMSPSRSSESDEVYRPDTGKRLCRVCMKIPTSFPGLFPWRFGTGGKRPWHQLVT